LPKQPVTLSCAHNNDRRQRNLKHLQTIKEMLS
jgi:hypothetical protein